MATRVQDSADVSPQATLGDGTSVWHLAQVREDAVLGENCIIGRGAYVGPGVTMGDNCKLQNYALVYEPAVLEDGVFVGPAVVFTNDHYPRSVDPDGTLKRGDDWEAVGVTVRTGASIGARAVCVAPVTIGRWAMCGRLGRHPGRPRLRARRGGAGPPDKVGGPRRSPARAGLRRWLDLSEHGSEVHPRGRPPDGGCTVTDFIPPAKPLIGDEEREAVDRVLRSGMLAQGPEVKAFEEEFSAHFGLGRACVAVNSGTSGLHLGLLSSGVKAGDEVIVPSFTFAATCNSVALTGATPVFADINADDFCLDPAAVEAAVTERTVGIMPVHLYGHPAAMPQLQAVADAHGLKIFEDAAQAHGASLGGTPVGAFGQFAMFSLYPTKNMTSGEGGMVSVADAETEHLMRLYRNQGMEQQYHNEVVGFNTRMTDIHAAIGRVQLTKVGAWTKTRQENAAFLSANLEGVTTPPVADGAVHVYHQYTVRVAEDRDGFARALREEYQVGCGMFYPVPNHRLTPFQVDVDLPETERAAAECLSLPVHPSLSQGDLERIVAAVNALAKAGA